MPMTDLARAGATDETSPVPENAKPTAEATIRSDNSRPAGDHGPARSMDATELGVARAAALFERADPGKAAAMLEPALAADPESAEGWILMGRIRLTLDEVDRALDAAAKAIALAPGDARPLAAASRALTLLGQHEEAVTMAYRAVIAEPKNPRWHDRVAWSLLAADRQIGDAEQAARTAIGLDPNEAHYYFTHGVTLDALGHADQARQALLISLRLEPENPVAQHRLAVLNGESTRAPAKKRRGWRMFGRRSGDGGKPVRPEEFLP
jgi:tetratricopeptide (TPR) repeat protein